MVDGVVVEECGGPRAKRTSPPTPSSSISPLYILLCPPSISWGKTHISHIPHQDAWYIRLIIKSELTQTEQTSSLSQEPPSPSLPSPGHSPPSTSSMHHLHVLPYQIPSAAVSYPWSDYPVLSVSGISAKSLQDKQERCRRADSQLHLLFFLLSLLVVFVSVVTYPPLSDPTKSAQYPMIFIPQLNLPDPPPTFTLISCPLPPILH